MPKQTQKTRSYKWNHDQPEVDQGGVKLNRLFAYPYNMATAIKEPLVTA